MKQVGAAFENFMFKSFDFSGRASLLEYWLLMPLVWGFIIFLAIGDIAEAWEFLSRRQKPPLNPLYWDALVVFVITIIPRMSLTVRRLHDSGKSGKWVKLPFVALISGFWMVIGIMVAIFTLSGSAQSAGMMMVALSIFAGSLLDTGGVDGWQVIFSVVAMINAIGFDVIWSTLSEMMPASSEVNIVRGAQGLASSGADGAAMGIQMMFMVAVPFVSIFLHFFFMISPGKPDHELDNTGLMSGATLRRQGAVSDNPFAGYKYLYAKSPEQEAAQKAAAKEEIKSLYQQRVLGGGQPV